MVDGVAVAVGDVADAVLAEGGRPERVSAVAVELRRDAAAEREGGEGVVVCEEDDGVDELGQGPAVRFRLQELLRRDGRERRREPRQQEIGNLKAPKSPAACLFFMSRFVLPRGGMHKRAPSANGPDAPLWAPPMISEGYITADRSTSVAQPLTSMCSLVSSQGRWARILLSSPSCCSLCGAWSRPFNHFRSPPTCRKSLTCRLTK